MPSPPRCSPPDAGARVPLRDPRPALAGLALAALACGCSGGWREGAADARTLELLPELACEEALELAEQPYLALRVPPDVHPWQVAAPRVEVRGLPDLAGELADALWLWGNDEKRIVIPGEFDPQRFDQVRIGLLLRVSAQVRVSLLRAGEAVLHSSWVSVAESQLPQVVTARFADNLLQSEPYDALEILLPAGLGGPVCIKSVDLSHKPFPAWVLGADGAPRLIRVAHEYRLGVGLGGPLARTARFRAELGARLCFSYALAPELHLPGQRARLRVRLAAGGAPLSVEELPLERGPREELRWHSAAIALDEFAGRDVELRIELEGGPLPAFGYLGELRVVRGGEEPPAVLLVTSDTHRADHLGAAAPQLHMETPALDALAARGVLFARCQSSTNITLPSHAALLTGLHPRDTRIVDNVTPLADEAHTLAEVFRARGWRTFAAVAASHLGPMHSGLGQGFERYSIPVPTTIRPADLVVADVEEWLADAAGEPLFVWLHLFDAHMPYEPPEELARRHLERPLALPTDGAELGELDEDLRLQRARYRGEVSFLDAQLGRLLAQPRFERGIVAVTADHGECLGQHGIYYDHAELYPDTVQVPLILSWPGGPAGARVSLPTQHLGLGRTLLDLADMMEEPFPGRSLLEALAPDARGEPLFAIAFAGQSASITHGERHLILHLADHAVDKGGKVRERACHEVELYDLANDPACERDLVAERHAQARELRAILVRFLAHAAPGGLAAQPVDDPALHAELAALGYTSAAVRSEGPWIDPECGCERCLPFR